MEHYETRSRCAKRNPKGGDFDEEISSVEGIESSSGRILGGRFEVLKVVGEGAYGVVMRCRRLTSAANQGTSTGSDEAASHSENDEEEVVLPLSKFQNSTTI